MAISKEDLHQAILKRYQDVTKHSRFYHYTSLAVLVDHVLPEFKLRFSHPNNFNDPFDCNEWLLNHETTNKEFQVGMKESKIYTQSNRSFKRKIKRDYYKGDSTRRILNSEKKVYRMACFSKLSDEVLMWSHYADRHKGVCVGFDFPHLYEDKFILVPVIYEDKIEPFSGLANNLEVILHWLTTKSKRWEYEEEIRAIMRTKLISDQYDYVQVDPSCIREIVFGCNVPDQVIRKSLKKFKNAGLKLKDLRIARMRINPKTFLLKAEKIN
ncbi:MAG: DUF2971 domain-containing protein [Cyclobacteriaceae bacterium]